jgi:RHS repeat-associated protein
VESGLDHTLYRKLNWRLGRWMTPDPGGLAVADPFNPQSWNRYAYVNNNPINAVDPFGMCPTDGDYQNCEITVTAPPPDDVQLIPIDMCRDLGLCGFPHIPGTDPSDYIADQSSQQTVPNSTPRHVGTGAAINEAKNCPAVPDHPAFANVNNNIRAVLNAKILGVIPPLVDWYKNVNTRGPWDYKQIRPLNDFGQPDKKSPYEDFGNFNYGATAAAMGIPLNIALRGAGWKQPNPDPSWKHWYSLQAPYGDDPRDQEQIRAGYQYYKSRCY